MIPDYSLFLFLSNNFPGIPPLEFLSWLPLLSGWEIPQGLSLGFPTSPQPDTFMQKHCVL